MLASEKGHDEQQPSRTVDGHGAASAGPRPAVRRDRRRRRARPGHRGGLALTCPAPHTPRPAGLHRQAGHVQRGVVLRQAASGGSAASSSSSGTSSSSSGSSCPPPHRRRPRARPTPPPAARDARAAGGHAAAGNPCGRGLAGAGHPVWLLVTDPGQLAEGRRLLEPDLDAVDGACSRRLRVHAAGVVTVRLPGAGRARAGHPPRGELAARRGDRRRAPRGAADDGDVDPAVADDCRPSATTATSHCCRTRGRPSG